MLFSDCVTVLDAHSLDSFTIANFNYLKNSLKDICHVKLALHDGTGNPAARKSLGDDIVVVSNHDIFGSISNAKDNNGMVRPGNRDLKNIAVFNRLQRIEVFIVVEYDVLCIGNPADIFSRLIRDFVGHDLAVSYFNTFANVPKWEWWSSLHPPAGVSIDDSGKYKSFLPLQMSSRRMMECYERELAAGWRGHYEVLVPTIAMRNELRILNLSDGKYRYTRLPYFGIELPETLDAEALPPFIHPVKTYEAFDALPEETRKTCLENGFPSPSLPAPGTACSRGWIKALRARFFG